MGMPPGLSACLETVKARLTPKGVLAAPSMNILTIRRDSYARLLFEMSSVLPSHVAKLASDKGYRIAEGARGFMFNADPKDIANFFDIGTVHGVP